MLKYLAKFAVDIVPSVAATVIGAYIVNHYVTAKSDAPAASVSRAVSDAKPAPKPVDAVIPPQATPLQASAKAKGASDSVSVERSAAEKPAVAEKPAEKSADLKSEDSAAEPSDQRHHPVTREKAAAKVQSAASTAAPSPAPVETTATPEERRAASDLARAAIERLRLGDGAQRAQGSVRPDASRPVDVVRATDTPRISDAPRTAPSQAVLPLPPPIMVSAPPTESASDQNMPPQTTAAIDPSRPTPPADIPATVPPPLDLRAEAAAAPPVQERRNIGDDMLSAAKSMFHAVLPK